jgi:hypothetical protein
MARSVVYESLLRRTTRLVALVDAERRFLSLVDRDSVTSHALAERRRAAMSTGTQAG